MKKIYVLLAILFSTTLSFGQLIINEVLYDPSNTALDGDANGDGVYDQEEDSFIEFYNSGTTNLDVSGYQIFDDTAATTPVYTVAPGTLIPPGGVMVVFGGGTPTGNFGGAVVLAADTAVNGLSLNNSGEVIEIQDASNNVLLTYDTDILSNNPNESYTRNPDITGAFEQHNDNTIYLFSPGLRIDSTAFDTNLIVESIAVQGMGGASTITTNFGTLQMVKSTLPLAAADTSATWSVVNGTGAASISTSGLLTAGSDGVVTVIATANDGSGIMGQTDITISNQTGILVTSIAVQGMGGMDSILIENGTLQMEATVLPINAADPTFTWSVPAANGVATIDASGLLTATGVGNVVVTATANDPSGITGTATITVSYDTTVFVSAITVQGENGDSAIVEQDGTLQMEAIITPTNATDASVTWSVSAGNIFASIDTNGLLTALINGEVEVTATANDGSGISGSTMIKVAYMIGISSLSDLPTISVFPNPVSDQLNFPAGISIQQVLIYDVTGKLVHTASPNGNTLDVTNLEPGMYFMTVSGNEVSAVTQFVKH